jgi:mono/diheme cytochrome c family protein
MIAKRLVAAIIILILASAWGCNRLPGKPTEDERWVATDQIADLAQLYSQNCSGCHGTDGRLGAARPLNDPLYLSLITPDNLRQIIKRGIPSTTMPAFGQQFGGSLTDAQVDLMVDQMSTRWGRPDEFKDVTVPPYSVQETAAGGPGPVPSDPQRGFAVYGVYCAQCHGADGTGGAKGGSIVDPNFLRLASDQSLRTTVIAGRQDIGKPDWRGNVSGRPMSPGEISDVVAWLAAQRPKAQSDEPGTSAKR